MKYFNNQIGTITIMLFLAGSVALFTIDYSNVQNPTEVKEKGWTLTALDHIKASSNDRKLLQRLNIWKSKAEVTSTTKSDVNWSLKGIVFESNTPYVLVYQKADKKLFKYTINDSLPNGEKIKLISKNYLTFELKGETITKKLHQYQAPL